MSDVVLKEKTEEGILILTLNRPQAMNCMNFEMIALKHLLPLPRSAGPNSKENNKNVRR